MMWVLFSIFYGAVKSIIFSTTNPPGSRVVSISFTSEELTMLIVSGIVFLIAWVMDEGRCLKEENELTI